MSCSGQYLCSFSDFSLVYKVKYLKLVAFGNMKPGTRNHTRNLFFNFACMEKVQLPDIWFFNPTCEYAVANGNAYWQPNQLLQKMEKDLSTLPLFFARSNDIVLIRKMLSENYLHHLKNIGFSLPRFLLLEEAIKTKANGEKLNRLLPWGWSPTAHKLFEPLKASCSDGFLDSPVANWEAAQREFYSKKFSLGILENLLPMLPKNKVLPTNMLPQVESTREGFQSLIDRWGKIMVKAPWSSSGRGLQPITKTPVVPKVWEKLMGIVNEQGYAIVEPLLDKVLDMALQFELKAGKINSLGKSVFMTDKKGQYQGNFLKKMPENILPETRQIAKEIPEMLKSPLTKILEESSFAENYEGNFGVDILIYRDEEGQLRLNPCLEINMRQNMGLLSLQLEKYLAPGSKGLFKTFYQKGVSFSAFANEMNKKYPPVITDNKIDEGFFALTDINEDAQFGAYIIAEK
jgi:hypothetical protein